MTSNRGRRYTAADLALLWSRCGGVCCFPNCNVECVLEATNRDSSVTIGQIAHIEAKSNSGPRANPSLSDGERDVYPNLILLCPTHHRLVDARESTYTVDLLRRWKADCEARFRGHLAQGMAGIGFGELQVVTEALVNNGLPTSDSLSVIPPREKMVRNGLTDETEALFSIGLIQSKQVEQFVERMSGIDGTFIGRLTSGFVDEYQLRVHEGLEGDSLFEAMRLFSAQGRTEIQYQSAGLAVLVYLFERCEVFEQ